MQVLRPLVVQRVQAKPVAVATGRYQAHTQMPAAPPDAACLGVGRLPLAQAQRRTSLAVWLVVTAVSAKPVAVVARPLVARTPTVAVRWVAVPAVVNLGGVPWLTVAAQRRTRQAACLVAQAVQAKPVPVTTVA